MTSFQFDVSELHALADELGGLPPKAARAAQATARKAAQNIKRDWQYDAAFSRHFRLAPTISYDENVWFGAVYEAEIGPNRRYRAARLAGIAHFGGANGGGGTLQDPDNYVASEAPRFEKAMADIIDEVLGR